MGLNHDLSYDDAAFVAKVSTEMTHNFEKEEGICSKDSYVACAVEAGLFDMLLKFFVSYSNIPDVDEDGIMGWLFKNIEAVSGVASSKRTSKALCAVRPKVMAALTSPQIKQLTTTSGAYKMIIENMLSLFSWDGKKTYRSPDQGEQLVCTYCSKGLSDEESRYCSKCKTAVYCSRDW